MKSLFASSLSALAASALFLATATSPVTAADYTWDTATGDGATITAGSGNWNTTATNWNNGSTNVAWGQAGTGTASHNAIFAGADGTYTVTLSGTTNAQSVAFNNSGYTLTSGTLTLKVTSATNGNITVAAGKTATVNSNIAFNNNFPTTITSNAGSTLNLGGGASNSQYNFVGAGTVNMTGGTYIANVGKVNNATFNQTGGTFTMQPNGLNTGYSIGVTAGQSVTYTMSGSSIMNFNSQSTGTNSFLAIGKASGTNSYTNTLNVTGAANLNVGNTASRSGELQIASDNNSNGTLNVTGGAVTVGTGTTDNKIYFFKAGSGAGYTANLTQSAGTVTANGIQFGGTATSYDATSSANLTVSGGVFYVGLQGITRGSGASTLQSNIKFQGGVIGASDNWSSSLDMKLGTTSGGPTFQAATSGTVSKNITLSGILSNDDSVNGKLTKTGAGTLTLSGSNTYTGATAINAGTLALGASNVLPDASAVSIGAATLNVATFADAAGTLDPTGAATINLGTGATLEFADSSAVDWTGGTLNITGTFIPGSSLRFGTTSGGLTETQLAKISSTGFSNFILDENGYLAIGDSTEPTLVSIVDNRAGGPIAQNTLVTYTVTFSEAIEPTSIGIDDFTNGGTATCTMGTVTQVSPTVFTVQATPTTTGTLILQIPTTASILDFANNSLICDPALNDDTTITVNDSPAPTISASNIADDKTGQIVAPNIVVTYTLTFSEDIDDATVTSADFGNAGTATITIGTITETIPGVFTVQVTPTSTGTLQFKINAGAVIKAASSGGASPGNVLDTTSAITDADTITVGSYLFWDTVSGDGSALTSGTGTWNTTAGNTVWNNVGGNVIWSQTSASVGSNHAVFAGTDGTTDQHVITVGGAMAAQSLTFANSGYKLTSGTVTVTANSTTNGDITVAANKTATISSNIGYANNAIANVTANSGATLNLGGGATNSQYRFSGAGTINMTAGTYTANVGRVNAATFNHSGGTYNMNLPTGGDGHYIGYTAGRSVSYTLSGSAILNVNASSTTHANSFLAIGRTAGSTAYSNTLNVQGAGNLNIGNTANTAGELHIAADAFSNGTLNVTGGTVLVGTGKADNKIYFFKAGSGAGYAANLTQSGGTVTANGIQFGGSTGATTYNATSAANLTLSGSSAVLYVGVQGISRGTDAEALPVAIKLQGGTIGASDNWSSSLDMKLGTTGGGPTFKAATSGNASKNITLSGVLSNDAAVNGTLTKTGAGTLTLSGTGANTFTGATLVSAGTLELGKVDAVSSSSGVTIANGAALSLSSTSSTVTSLTFNNTGTLNFEVAAGGYNLTVNNTDGVTNNGTAGSVTINITGSAPANGTYTLIDYSGTLQGSGFNAYTLGTMPLGKSYTLANDTASGAVQLVVDSAYTWTGSASSEWSTNVIAEPKNWTKDGVAIDYANDLAAFFDDTATNKTVEITGTNVTPLSVTVSSGTYTLQGSYTIAGSAPVTVSSGAILKLGSSNVLPNGAGTGNVTVNGTLDLNGNSDTINALTGSGVVDNTAAATTSTLSLGANGGGTFSGALKNTGGTLALTKTGATDITLSGSNSYSGATTVNQNRLFISNSNAFSPSTAVTVNNGASFILNTTGTYAQSITLNSGANLAQRQAATLSNVTLPSSGSVIFNTDDVATQAFTLASPQTLGGSLDVRVGGGAGAPGTITLSGILSGASGSLVKSGTGTLVLSGSSSFGGGFSIKNGTVEAKTTNTPMGTGTVTMGGTGSTGATLITGKALSNAFVINAPDSGSVLIGANGNGSAYTLSGGITLNGNLTLQTYNNPADAVIKATGIISGGITGTGDVVLNNNGLSANVFNITTAAVNHTGSITLQGTGTGDTTISAPIGANVTGITQSSTTSTLVLSGTNTYAGNLTINAGTVRISNNSNTANDVSTVTLAATGATLNLTYAGTDTVDKLIIDSVEQPAGVYGKLGSTDPSVTQTIAQITGDGTLTVGAPEIAVEQPVDTNIASGGSQDFGSVDVGSNTSLTFTVRNSGNLGLNLTGTPLVAVGGTHAGDFTVTAAPSSTVAAAGTTTFTVQFAPGAEGARSATLTIANNDSNEGTFVINVGGTGTIAPAPEIAVEQPVDTNIASGGSQDFGSVEVGSNTSLTFTVRNSGNATLSLSGTPLVAVGGTHAGDFTVTAAPSSTVSAAGTTTFTVQFAPGAEGARSATLTIANNDSNEGTFVINVGGTGTAVSDPFAAWSGGASFDADANGDGVSNGLAWILGAADASTNASSLLPSVSISGENIVFTFTRNQESINAATALTIEAGTTLGAWPDTYTVGADSAGSSAGVTVDKDTPSAGTDTVTLTVPRAPDDKKFVRLKAVLTP